MPIDWAATGAMLSGWATLAGAGAVVYAAKTGADTFAAWKRQKVEERRMDAAERIMTVAYRLRYAFNSIRVRAIFVYETKAAEDHLDNSLPHWRTQEHPEKSRLRTAQIILNRLKANDHLWQEIWTLKPIALAFFGETVESTLHSFWAHYVSVETAASMYADDTGSDPNFSTSLRRDLFGDDDDSVSTRVADAIRKLEDELLPIIRTEYRNERSTGMS